MPAAPTPQLEKSPQVFTWWSGTQDIPPMESVNPRRLLSTREHRHQGWVISVSAVEVARQTDEALGPLHRDKILREGVPSSRLHARIGWMRAGEGTHVDVDIGTGFRLCVEGCEAELDILGPKHQVHEPQHGTTLGHGGIYLDTIVTAQIIAGRIERMLPNTLTQSFTVPVGGNAQSIEVPIPRFARSLKAHALEGQGSVLTYRMGERGPAVARVHVHASSGSSNDPIPQIASHISLPAHPSVPRRLTLIWSLEL